MLIKSGSCQIVLGENRGLVTAILKGRGIIMTIQTTSIEAYHDLKEKGVVGKQEDYYLELLRRFDNRSDSEMAVYMQIPAATVSARRNGILKRNPCPIEYAGKRICKVSGRRVRVWQLKKEA